MRRKILEHVTSKGCLYKSELDEWMRSQGMAVNKAQNTYSSLVESGELAKITVKGTSKVIVGTPVEIERMLSGAPVGMYRS